MALETLPNILEVSPTMNPTANMNLVGNIENASKVTNTASSSTILGVLGIIAAVGSAIAGAVTSRKNRKAQEQANQENWEHTLYLQNYQNEYNSPKAQMERLEEAGLNPNLVYGQGGATQAASTDNYTGSQAPRREFDLDKSISLALTALQLNEEMKNNAAQRDYYRALASKTDAQAQKEQNSVLSDAQKRDLDNQLKQVQIERQRLEFLYEQEAEPLKIQEQRQKVLIAEANARILQNKDRMLSIDLQYYDERQKMELQALGLDIEKDSQAIERAKFDLQFLKDVRDFNYIILQEGANLKKEQVRKLGEEINIMINRGASSDEIINLINDEIQNPTAKQYVKAAYYLLGQIMGFGIKIKNANKTPVYNTTENHTHTGGTVVNSYKNNTITAN